MDVNWNVHLQVTPQETAKACPETLIFKTVPTYLLLFGAGFFFIVVSHLSFQKIWPQLLQLYGQNLCWDTLKIDCGCWNVWTGSEEHLWLAGWQLSNRVPLPHYHLLKFWAVMRDAEETVMPSVTQGSLVTGSVSCTDNDPSISHWKKQYSWSHVSQVLVSLANFM